MRSGYKGKESKNYTSRTKQSRRVCRVEEEEDEDDVVEAPLYKITSETKVPPIPVQIDDCLAQMEVDTGAVPETIVSDNGTCFTSEEFEIFLKSINGIKHYTSAPYHPASNGLAERAVQIIKHGLKKETVGDIEERLAKILFNYRITPQTTTGISPSELLLGGRSRSRLDLLKPNIAHRVEKKQSQQKEQHDSRARLCVFTVGQNIFLKNYGAGRRWLPGIVI